jgi:hypothetical protein
VTDLSLGETYQGTLAGSPSLQLFRVALPVTSPLSVYLNDSSESDSNELYVRRGLPPSRTEYDARSPGLGGPDQSLLMENATAGDWYIAVCGVAVATPSAFALEATTSSVIIAAVTPNTHGSIDPLTMTIGGAGFTSGMQATLVATPSGNEYAASALELNNSTRVTATFDMSTIAAGDTLFDVRIIRGGVGDTIPAALTFQPGDPANFTVDLVLPGSLGRHAIATLYVT